jgi:predicted phage terminase large subunit-like protein
MIATQPPKQEVKKIQVEMEFHQKQLDYLRSQTLYRGFVGGRGAGKTFVGSSDLIFRSKPGRTYMVASPTAIIMRDTTLPMFEQQAKALNIIQASKQTPYPEYVLSTGAKIKFRTADDPEKLRGPNLSGVWLDEASLMHEDVYKIVIACLREAGEQGWLGATFTPKGKLNWTYKVFGQNTADTQIFKSKTRENPFNPPRFEQTLRKQYTNHFATQELGGEFVDAAGSIFRREDFKLVTHLPATGTRVRYWDKAGTQDGGCYTVGVLMLRDDSEQFFVEDVRRFQLSPLQRNKLIKQTAELDRQQYGYVCTVIEREPASSGIESAEISLRDLAGFDIRIDHVTGDKLHRAMPFAAQAEGGNIHVKLADWTEEYLSEISAHPFGEFKDQGDASSGAFNWICLNFPLECEIPHSEGRTVLDELPAGVF